MRVILYFLLLLLARPIWAQTVISGKLIDEEQQPIPGVSVIYKKVGASAMNGFARTDSEGESGRCVKGEVECRCALLDIG